MPVFERVIVPLVTPFTDDTTAISEVRSARLVRHYLDSGAAGFVVCTDAGEVFSLSHSERKQFLEWVIRDARGESVYVNVTSNTTANVIDLAQHAGRHGAKSAIVCLPSHTPLTEAETNSFVASVRRHANVPVTFMKIPVPDDEGLGLLNAISFEESGIGPLALYRGISSEEFVIGAETATLLGIFGATTARKVARDWVNQQGSFKSLFAHGRSHRVGKAALAALSVDMGHPRGPIHDLDSQGVQMLDAVLEGLG